MSFDTSEFIRKHFSALEEEGEEFTSNQSKTYSQLPGQLEAEEARELEEELRISTRKQGKGKRRREKLHQMYLKKGVSHPPQVKHQRNGKQALTPLHPAPSWREDSPLRHIHHWDKNGWSSWGAWLCTRPICRIPLLDSKCAITLLNVMQLYRSKKSFPT